MSHLAKALGQAFAPWLPSALAAAISSLTLDDGASNSKDERQDAQSPVSTALATDSSEEDEDEDEREARMNIHTGARPLRFTLAWPCASRSLQWRMHLHIVFTRTGRSLVEGVLNKCLICLLCYFQQPSWRKRQLL